MYVTFCVRLIFVLYILLVAFLERYICVRYINDVAGFQINALTEVFCSMLLIPIINTTKQKSISTSFLFNSAVTENPIDKVS